MSNSVVNLAPQALCTTGDEHEAWQASHTIVCHELVGWQAYMPANTEDRTHRLITFDMVTSLLSSDGGSRLSEDYIQ
jgi:hypothetical protein